jgi:hypothetical protein
MNGEALWRRKQSKRTCGEVSCRLCLIRQRGTLTRSACNPVYNRVCQPPLPYRRHGVKATLGMLTRSVCKTRWRVANGKTPKAAINLKAAPPPTSGGKMLTRSVCKTRWRVANGKTPKAAINLKAAPPPTSGGKTLTRSVCKTRWRVANGKTPKAAINLKAAPTPTSSGKTLTRSVCASMANGQVGNYSKDFF